MTTTIKRPASTQGMKHIALFVKNFEACEQFYTELLGMTIEWRPDTNNVYLTSGNDNLALHRSNETIEPTKQKLDHIGFIIQTPEQVDDWYAFLKQHQIDLRQPPRTHRDGARSFYCYDPDGTSVQLIYHPPISIADNI
jgi:catechol 2,3-dioxygenase-like lactoylglutathione lyase family enzyme